MRSGFRLLCVTLLLTALPLSTATAETLSPQENDATLAQPATLPPSDFLSITLSPIHLISPIFELSAEYKAIPKLGIALIAGFGSQAVEFNESEYKFTVWELGAQARYYALGDFNHGLQLGAEALYINIADNKYTDGLYEISAYGTRLALGAFIGYKIITNVGFTFEAQGGVQIPVMLDDKPQSTTTVVEEGADDIAPLININIGWSF